MEDNIRPWGRYDILFEDDNCKVKQITVNPNSKLSYQYHEKRKECWVVTKGQLTLVLNEAEKEFKDIVFLSYEQSKNKDIAQKLGIKFWTTIVVYKGNDEVARIVGQTDKETIYSAIQKGI